MKEWIVEKLIFSFAALLILTSMYSFIFRVLAPFPTTSVIRPPWAQWPEWMRWHFAWDQPIHIRCLRYIVNMFSFNFGLSFLDLRPVTAELWRPLQYTLLVFLPAFLFTIMVSVPARIYCFARKGRAFGRRLLTAVASVFSWVIPINSLLINAHIEDYMLLRRAIGFDERKTLWKLVFRNTLPLALMVTAFSIPYLVMGTMIAENVFSLNGIGRWFTRSLMAEDRPVIEAVLFIYQILTVFAGFLVSLMSSRAK